MKLISFDLEIAKSLPDGFDDWQKFAPLGITCVALAIKKNWKENYVSFFQGIPRMTKAEASALVDDMLERYYSGNTFLTFNGTSFDFHVLAQESGRYDDCAGLAWNHVDLMLIATIQKGWYVGLDSCLQAHGLKSKEHRVKLKDGSWIDDMGGAKAPQMWALGETEAVLTYLRRDVESQMELASSCLTNGSLHFKSKNGKMHSVRAVHDGKLFTVKEIMAKPMADNSWMDKPPTKSHFVEWMNHLTVAQSLRDEIQREVKL